MACDCRRGSIVSSGDYSYTSCDGVFTEGVDALGFTVCFDLNEAFVNITNIGEDSLCTCADLTPSPTCEKWSIANATGSAVRIIYRDCCNDLYTVLIPNGGSPTVLCLAKTYSYDAINSVTEYNSNSPLILIAGITVTYVENCAACVAPPTPPTPIAPTPSPVPTPSAFTTRTVKWVYEFSGDTCTELEEYLLLGIDNIYTNGLGIVVGNLAYQDAGLTTLLPSGIYRKTDNTQYLVIELGQIISIF